MRCLSFACLLATVLLPLEAATVNFEVSFLTEGGQNCILGNCFPVASGQVTPGTFSLDDSQLAIDGLVDITAAFNSARVVSVPATGTGTQAVAARVQGGSVVDILIGVEWVNFVLDFGQNYSFTGGEGQWLLTNRLSGGPLLQDRTEFGSFTITEASTVPEPNTAFGGLAAISLLVGVGLHRRRKK